MKSQRAKKLYLSTFIRLHESYASEATQSKQSYTRFLLALAEQEVLKREARRRQRRLKEAKIPVIKDLTNFDFAQIPELHPQKIQQLIAGTYIDKAEPVILFGLLKTTNQHFGLMSNSFLCHRAKQRDGIHLHCLKKQHNQRIKDMVV